MKHEFYEALNVGYLDEDLEDITELMDARVDLAIKLQHAAVLQCLNNREW